MCVAQNLSYRYTMHRRGGTMMITGIVHGAVVAHAIVVTVIHMEASKLLWSNGIRSDTAGSGRNESACILINL
jgi:hypothetical protein